MGRVNTSGSGWSIPQLKGLRRRWLINSVGVICALGLVCVSLITAVFAMQSYSNMESDIRHRAGTTIDFFADFLNQDDAIYYSACLGYIQSFADRDTIELQLLNADGELVASSNGQVALYSPDTPEMQSSVAGRALRSYVGVDPTTGHRIMAVSGPVLRSTGQLIGVLRFVAPTTRVDRQILAVAAFSFAVLVIVVLVVCISGNYYMRSILIPLGQIIEKAKMIASGSYGILLQTGYDDEIGDLADAINELSLKISQNEKLQSEFVSSLSHELRTPLTAITGWSETLLGSDDLSADTQRGMKIIHKEAQRLSEMVLELLEFTRLQDGRMTLNMEPTDIRAEFEDTVYMYGSRLKQEGVLLQYRDTDEELPVISCDPKRLRQVFLNLLDNAVRHGGSGKRIDADIACVSDRIVIHIRDYGPGIPEDELPLVKKKFYKGSAANRGSGIGLSVCDEILQMHGGRLVLENASNGGTLVTIELPVTQ